MEGFKASRLLPRFASDYGGLPPDIKDAVDACLKDLKLSPIPKRRRVHSLNRAQRPRVFTADVFPNKSYKLSFHIEGDGTFVFRRIGTHKELDRHA